MRSSLLESLSSQIKKEGPRIFFQIGSDGFLVKKCVCLSLALSDSYEFSNGNLASCVLTEIAPPAHLGSAKKEKKGTVRGMQRKTRTVHEILIACCE